MNMKKFSKALWISIVAFAILVCGAFFNAPKIIQGVYAEDYETYTVNLDLNGGTCDTSTLSFAKSDATVTLPSDEISAPEKYTFIGWFIKLGESSFAGSDYNGSEDLSYETVNNANLNNRNALTDTVNTEILKTYAKTGSITLIAKYGFVVDVSSGMVAALSFKESEIKLDDYVDVVTLNNDDYIYVTGTTGGIGNPVFEVEADFPDDLKVNIYFDANIEEFCTIINLNGAGVNFVMDGTIKIDETVDDPAIMCSESTITILKNISAKVGCKVVNGGRCNIAGEASNATVVEVEQNIEKPYFEVGANTAVFTGSLITFTPTGFDANYMVISGNEQTNIGENYELTITLKDGYTWSDKTTEAVKLQFSITAKSIEDKEITANADTTYDGTSKLPNASITGLTANDYDLTYTYKAIGESEFTTLDTVVNNFVNAGEYKITATGKGNYTGSITKVYTISKADQNVTISVGEKTENIGLTYAGDNFVVAINGTDIACDVNVVNGTGAGSATQTSLTVTKAGTLTLEVKNEGNDNYNSFNKQVSIIISKGEVNYNEFCYAVTEVEKHSFDQSFTNVLTNTNSFGVQYSVNIMEIVNLNTENGEVELKDKTTGLVTITATIVNDLWTGTTSYNLTVNDTFKITASGDNAITSLDQNATAIYGTQEEVTISATSGYLIKSVTVKVGGSLIEQSENYTFEAGILIILGDVIKGDVEIVIETEKEIVLYTIVWDVNGEKNSQSGLTAGETIVCPLIEPTKNSDKVGSVYEFTGWSPAFTEGDKVTGNVTYVAQFEEVKIKYEVQFNYSTDYFTEISKSVYDIEHGTEITVNGNGITIVTTPETVVAFNLKANDAQYTYAFTGFEIEEETFTESMFVTENVTIDVIATRVVNKYTVTWKMEGQDTPLKVETNIPYGTIPSFNGIPVKQGTEFEVFNFIGWDKPLAVVEGDVTYTAVFETELIKLKTDGNVDGNVSVENALEDGTKLVMSIIEKGETNIKAPKSAKNVSYYRARLVNGTDSVKTEGNVTYSIAVPEKLKGFDEVKVSYINTTTGKAETVTAEVRNGRFEFTAKNVGDFVVYTTGGSLVVSISVTCVCVVACIVILVYILISSRKAKKEYNK